MDSGVYDAIRDTNQQNKESLNKSINKHDKQYKAIKRALHIARLNCHDYDCDIIIEQNKALLLSFK